MPLLLHLLLCSSLLPSTTGVLAPSNDLCIDARPVGAGQAVPFSTIGASVTAVTPGCGNFGGILGPDVWFLYQATQDGVLTVDACSGATFDSVVAVYEGDDCGSLAQSPRGCNDDACGLASRLDVAVRAGTPYLIQVGGFSGFDTGTGTLELVLQAGATLPFDDCSEAGTLVCGGSVTFDPAGASFAPGEPAFACSTGATLGTLWFEFVATADTALLSTFEQPNVVLDIDSVFAVHAGSCDALLPIACSDDLAPGEDLSRVLLQGLTPGTSYRVQVSVHVGGPSGASLFPCLLTLACPSPCESLAGATRRSAASNPEVYEVVDPPLLGTTFLFQVDSAAAGGKTSLLFAFDAPASVMLGGGQTLLALDAGSGELFTGAGLTPGGIGPLDDYALFVPNDTALCGLRLHSQALVLGAVPFVLTNAQDLVLGF